VFTTVAVGGSIGVGILFALAFIVRARITRAYDPDNEDLFELFSNGYLFATGVRLSVTAVYLLATNKPIGPWFSLDDKGYILLLGLFFIRFSGRRIAHIFREPAERW
jgi:hypothetical protein